jgi:hypothetical protein
MKLFYFLLFVIACAGIVTLFIRRSQNLEHHPQAGNRNQAPSSTAKPYRKVEGSLLSNSGEKLPSRDEAIWQSRRQHASHPPSNAKDDRVVVGSASVVSAEITGTTEADRDLDMTTIEYESVELSEEAKNAG